MTTVNVTATMSMTENEFKALLTYNDLVFIIQTTVNIYSALNYSEVVFGRTQPRRNVYSGLFWSFSMLKRK